VADEGDFLHKLTNHLASAKLATELAIEILQDEKCPSTEALSSLQNAVSAMTMLQMTVKARHLAFHAE